MSRDRMLSDAQWAKMSPLLPDRLSRGRPWRDNREVLQGILWVLRTGARWKGLPGEFPSPSSPPLFPAGDGYSAEAKKYEVMNLDACRACGACIENHPPPALRTALLWGRAPVRHA